jgi:hypothetical protein
MTESRLRIDKLGPGDIALLRNVADEAAEKSVRGMLTAIGLDPKNPIESQACFVRLREMVADPESRTDMDWTRRTRRRTEGIIGKAILTAVALGVVGGCKAAWAFFVSAVASVQPQ